MIRSVELTAFILAGGRSSRMGPDKAFLLLNGQSLLQRALELACAITPEVRLVGSASRLGAHGPVVEDIYPGHGPLGGIHAALSASTTELNLILAVDTPFLSERFLRFLAESAAQSSATITLPRAGNRWHPLCAVYRRSFAVIAGQALQAGRNRIDALLPAVPLLVLEEQELQRLAFEPAMFDNLNTPEDWEKAQSRARA